MRDLYPNLMDILIFQFSKGAGTSSGFQSMFLWCRCVVDSLGNMGTVDCVNAERICELVKTKFWSWCSEGDPLCGSKGFALALRGEGCGPLGGLAVCRAGDCEP